MTPNANGQSRGASLVPLSSFASLLFCVFKLQVLTCRSFPASASLFETAAHPERVFPGICWQYVPDADGACFQYRCPREAQIRTLNVHAREARGPSWARAKAQLLWAGEDLVLQIDSHMRFVKGTTNTSPSLYVYLKR